MNIKQIRILNVLLKKDKTTPLKSVGISGLMTLLKDGKFGMSESTLRKYVGDSIKAGYIECGLKKEQEKRYYITKDGIDFVNELKGGDVE